MSVGEWAGSLLEWKRDLRLWKARMADEMGACTVALRPLHDLIAAHVMAAERLHGGDTPVPVLAKGKTDKGRAWVYVLRS